MHGSRGRRLPLSHRGGRGGVRAPRRSGNQASEEQPTGATWGFDAVECTLCPDRLHPISTSRSSAQSATPRRHRQPARASNRCGNSHDSHRRRGLSTQALTLVRQDQLLTSMSPFRPEVGLKELLHTRRADPHGCSLGKSACPSESGGRRGGHPGPAGHRWRHSVRVVLRRRAGKQPASTSSSNLRLQRNTLRVLPG